MPLLGCAGKGASTPEPVQVTTRVDATNGSSPVGANAPPDAITVQVRSESGAPVSGAVIAFMRNAEDTLPSTVTADARGQATIRSSSETEVTAVNATGFGRAKVIPGSALPVLIVLDGHCTQFEGTIEDQSAPAGRASIETVHFFPYGTSAPAAFSARIDDANRFQGCLPNGRYFADTELDEVGGGILFDVPSPSAIAYVGTRQSASQADAPNVGSPPATASDVARSLPANVGIVALGESTHGTAEYAVERARFTLELAKSKRVRFVLLEAGLGDTLALDRYVRTGTGDVHKAVAALQFWMWDTEEFVKGVELLRQYNKKRPARERIGFVGTDVQTTAGAVSYLLDDRSTSLSDAERTALSKVPDIDDSDWSTVSEVDKRLVDDALARLAKPRRINDTRALAAASIQSRLKLVGTGTGLNQMRVRDQLMADMAVRISDGGNQLSVVWAHMGHVARRYMFGQDTMGTILGSRLGPRYVVLAMLSVSGSARAWDADFKIGVIPHTLTDAPPYALERALAVESTEPSYVMFAQLSHEMQAWLSKLRYLRSIGGVYDPDGGFTLYDVGHAFDGVVVFRRTSSSTPTPTGIRKAKAQ
ncbi:MAG TPA: erythromycin esterase family protein [Kofleriaceae bacterium]|nr:erythromycin esterase family protein [Kofleriaceae bacterium]